MGTFAILFAFSFVSFLVFFQVVHKKHRDESARQETVSAQSAEKPKIGCASCTCQGGGQRSIVPLVKQSPDPQ